jgi:hypothetical protein
MKRRKALKWCQLKSLPGLRKLTSMPPKPAKMQTLPF